MRYVRIGMQVFTSKSRLAQPNRLFKVRVGHDNLVGEVIRIEADKATVQVYEETGRRGCILQC